MINNYIKTRDFTDISRNIYIDFLNSKECAYMYMYMYIQLLTQMLNNE